MRKLRSSVLWLLLAGLCLSQTADMVTPDVRRVGDRLSCLCGVCKNTVATCQMLGCHYSSPAREKINTMKREGASDDQIVAEFVKKEGKKALAAPPTEGFNVMAWLMPPAAVLLGLGLIGWFVRRNRKPAPEPPLQENEMDRYQKAAEKELSGFDE